MLNAAENKFDVGDLFMNGGNHRGKTPPGEFKVTTTENPRSEERRVGKECVP